MLEIIIVFAIYIGLQKLLDNPVENKIRNAKTAEEANEYRKRLKKFRTAFFVIFLTVYIVFSIWLNFGVGEQDNDTIVNSIKGLCFGGLMMYQYLKQQKKYREFMGNVSTYGKNEYLEQNEHFALFLRGFEEDDYSKEEDLAKYNDSQKFSEYKFMSILQKRMPACAIGMTKETDSPYGAQRIYVNDDSWRQDVKELMEKAEEIYILVNDRNSCIWEIEQSSTMLCKTIFIIDEVSKYENVRKSLIISNNSFLPELPSDINITHHVILRFNNGIPTFEQFENTIESYSRILQIVVVQPHEKQIFYQKKGCWITIAVIFVIFILILLFG